MQFTILCSVILTNTKKKQGYQALGGQMIDATFQEVPTQHNTREEKEKTGKRKPLRKNGRPLPPNKKSPTGKSPESAAVWNAFFGQMSKLSHEMRKIFTKGLCPVKIKIGLKFLTYNMYRNAILRRIVGKLCIC